MAKALVGENPRPHLDATTLYKFDSYKDWAAASPPTMVWVPAGLGSLLRPCPRVTEPLGQAEPIEGSKRLQLEPIEGPKIGANRLKLVHRIMWMVPWCHGIAMYTRPCGNPGYSWGPQWNERCCAKVLPPKETELKTYKFGVSTGP